jgi:hypothetical protein
VAADLARMVALVRRRRALAVVVLRPRLRVVVVVVVVHSLDNPHRVAPEAMVAMGIRGGRIERP